MTAKRVECFTIVCDGCGADAFEDTDYTGWGPTMADAREVAECSDWTCDERGDFCWDCAHTDDPEAEE